MKYYILRFDIYKIDNFICQIESNQNHIPAINTVAPTQAFIFELSIIWWQHEICFFSGTASTVLVLKIFMLK